MTDQRFRAPNSRELNPAADEPRPGGDQACPAARTPHWSDPTWAAPSAAGGYSPPASAPIVAAGPAPIPEQTPGGAPAQVADPYQGIAPGGLSVSTPAPVPATGVGAASVVAPTPSQRRRDRRAVWVLLLIIALLVGLVGGVAVDRVFLAKKTKPILPAPALSGIGQSDVGMVASSALQSTVYIQSRSDTAGNDGTGVVYSGDGIIVTNAHVIMVGSEPASSITVFLPDGQSQEAVVVGYTRQYDLAVLRINASDLTAMPLAEANSAKVGDAVVAVGAPLGLTGTVTTGIVSALERPVRAGPATDSSYINALQTDAAINPGNSGGPLVNMQGELVGINSAIKQPYTSNGQAVGPVGLGFAIPVGQVKYTVEEILEQGYATYPVMGILLNAQDLSEGALITSSDGSAPAITPGGPADQAGLKEGDLIVSVNGKPIRSVTEFVVYLGSLKPGETVDIEVDREGETISATLTLSSRRAN